MTELKSWKSVLESQEKDYLKLNNSNLNIFFTFHVMLFKISQIPNFIQ